MTTPALELVPLVTLDPESIGCSCLLPEGVAETPEAILRGGLEEMGLDGVEPWPGTSMVAVAPLLEPRILELVAEGHIAAAGMMLEALPPLTGGLGVRAGTQVLRTPPAEATLAELADWEALAAGDRAAADRLALPADLTLDTAWLAAQTAAAREIVDTLGRLLMPAVAAVSSPALAPGVVYRMLDRSDA